MSRGAYEDNNDHLFEGPLTPTANAAFNATTSPVSLRSTPFGSSSLRNGVGSNNSENNQNQTAMQQSGRQQLQQGDLLTSPMMPTSEGAGGGLLGNRDRIPNRIFDCTPDELYKALQYCEEDVLAAIDLTKTDKYLERMAKRQLGDALLDRSEAAAGDIVYGGGDNNDGDHSLNHSRASASTTAAFDKLSIHVGGVGGVCGNFPIVSDGGEPPINGDIAPYVRPPKRLNRYKGYVHALETMLPFTFIVPVAVLCAILVGYMYAKLKLCGYGCDCTASEIALITFTFGLIRDLPCSVVFACLTEACVEHQRSAAQTTINRKTRLDSVGSRGSGSGGGGTMMSSIAMPPTAIAGRNGGTVSINGDVSQRYSGTGSPPSVPNAPYSYGPYILEDAFSYLRQKRVLALIVLGQLWVMLYRAFASPIGIPEKAQLPVLIAVKILPFLLYAFAKKKVAASSSACILIVMPLLIELVTTFDGSTSAGDNRSLWTGFFPLLVIAADRFFLFVINATSHPSRSSGALIIFCTMHAFFSQSLILGVALTIEAANHGELTAGYAVSFAVLEIILNTTLVETIGFGVWKRLRNCCGALSSGKKNLVDPLGKFSVPNVAALVRLPTLIVAFVFMLPAMHFEYYPMKTKAIDCDGKTHYATSWPTYGVLGGVIVFVAVCSCFLRFGKGTTSVPLTVYGFGWSLMVAFYCLQIVPLSLSFLPLIGGEKED